MARMLDLVGLAGGALAGLLLARLFGFDLLADAAGSGGAIAAAAAGVTGGAGLALARLARGNRRGHPPRQRERN